MHALVPPGVRWQREPQGCACLRSSVLGLPHCAHIWSCVSAVSRGEPGTEPGTGQALPWWGEPPQEPVQPGAPTDSDLGLPPRISTGCSRSCGLPLLRMRALASCSAASVARAEPQPPWWWLCSPSGTSEYVRCLVRGQGSAQAEWALGPRGHWLCQEGEGARNHARVVSEFPFIGPGQRANGAEPWQGAPGMRGRCSLGRRAPHPSSCPLSGLPRGGRGGARERA